MENDDVCLAMKSSCSLLDLGAGVGVVAKKLGQLDAGVDDLGGPSMSTYILEKKVAAMRGATCNYCTVSGKRTLAARAAGSRERDGSLTSF